MHRLGKKPFLLFALLYAGIALLAFLAGLLLPAPFTDAVRGLTGGAGLGAFDPAVLGGGRPSAPPETAMWAIAAVSMTAAGVLGLPVAWLYTITRHKRGYRQSVVHSLVLLPVVVAGVVVLAKYSLALAFSLAGIVAAVRFRYTLEDSKDAVYVFVATGIGLAAGVELGAAATLSFLFNLVTLLLFHFDFGRTPGSLEGEMAEERMQRALEIANRTSEFVARLDREILEEMAPPQLEALAERAWRRHREAADHTPGGAATPRDAVLHVRTDGGQRAREAIEVLLTRHAKRWHFVRAAVEDGTQALEYAVRLRKSVQPAWLLDAVRAEAAAGVLAAELT